MPSDEIKGSKLMASLYKQLSKPDVLAKLVVGREFEVECPKCHMVEKHCILPEFWSKCPQCGNELKWKFTLVDK